MNTIELREQRADFIGKCRVILDKAEQSKRELTAAEKVKYDGLLEEVTKLADKIERHETVRNLEDDLEKSLGRKTAPVGPTRQRLGGCDSETFDTSTDQRVAKSFVDVRSGKNIPVLSYEQRLTDHYGGGDFSIGRVIAAQITGRKEILSECEHRVLTGLTDISGGVWLTPQMSSRVLDLARDASVALRAGVLSVPMDTAEMVIVKVDSDPTPKWLAEGSTATQSEPTFGSVTLRARTLRVHTPISEELVMDSPNAVDTIEQVLTRSLGLALDKAILFGATDGTAEEPVGLRHITDVTEQASVGLPTHDDFSTAVENVMTNNAPSDAPLSLLFHPRTWGDMDRRKDGQGLPLVGPESWQMLKKFTTTSISITEGAGNNESFAIVGPFGEAILGLRMESQIFVKPITTGGTWQREIVAVLRADFVAPRPKFFVKLTGITS